MAKKRKQPHDEHIDETWLIPYADLLTLLLALFVVLFASSQIDSSRFEELSEALSAAFSGNVSFFENTQTVPADVHSIGQKDRDDDSPLSADERREEEQRNEILAQIEQETKDLEELKALLDTYIEENQLGTELDTELNHTHLKIVIRDNALFASGSAEVVPQARALANAISAFLVDYPQYEVVVAGHTDTDPISTAQFRSNWDLSAYRALNFMMILLNNQQLEESRFSSVGYGEFRPVADNVTSAGKAKNRRVEVSILRNFQVTDTNDMMIINGPTSNN